MPIEWGVILTAAALIAATVIAVYALSTLKDWIANRIGIYRDRQIIAGALRDRLENGNYRVVPFIYDLKEKETIETDHIEAEKFDEKLEQKFAGSDEVIIETLAL